MIVQLNIKPFDSILDAINGLEVAFHCPSVLKFKCSPYNVFERERLTKLLTACKSLLTIEWNFQEFIKCHHIDCISKMLWESTSWEVKVQDFGTRIKVYSGTPLGGLRTDRTTTHDQRPYIANIMVAQLRRMLNEAQTVWGKENFEWVYNNDVQIISKKTQFNKYPAYDNDYYDIY